MGKIISVLLGALFISGQAMAEEPVAQESKELSKCSGSIQMAAAMSPKASTEEVIGKLEGKYKEVQAGLGFVSDKEVLQIYASSEEQQSWTVVFTHAKGFSAVLSSGIGFQQIEKEDGTISMGGYAEKQEQVVSAFQVDSNPETGEWELILYSQSEGKCLAAKGSGFSGGAALLNASMGVAL